MSESEAEIDFAIIDLESVVDGLADTFIRRLAERVGTPAGTGGVTTISIALARWGFGDGASFC